MSNNAEERIVPVWSIGDRLAKALQVSGVSHSAMADYLGVSRNSVTNYTRGHVKVDKRTLMLWSAKTRVPLEWLQTGESPPGDGPDGQPLPRLDSNQQPSGYGLTGQNCQTCKITSSPLAA